MSLFFSQHNGVVSLSPLLIDIFCRFHLFVPHGWVQLLVGIADYIGSTLLIDHIITIYHNCFSPSTMALFYCHSCRLLYFAVFIVSFPLMSATTCWYRWLHWKYFSERSHYHYISSFFSPSTMASFHCHCCWLLYFVVFIFPSHWWVRPFFGIADYIESTFLRDHVITLYNHCFSPSTMA